MQRLSLQSPGRRLIQISLVQSTCANTMATRGVLTVSNGHAQA